MGNASIRQMIKLFQDYKEKEISGWKTSYYNTLDRLYNMCMIRKYGASIGAYDNNGELIAGFEGSFSNVIGLPMETLVVRLAALGVRPFPESPASR